MGLEPQSPALPDWLSNWSDSCDKLSSALRDEEFSPADMQQNT